MLYRRRPTAATVRSSSSQDRIVMTYKMGVVGLGVMGANLARNIESRGFPVVGYDLDAEKTKAFLEGPAPGAAITGVELAGSADGGARAAAARADHGAGRRRRSTASSRICGRISSRATS